VTQFHVWSARLCLPRLAPQLRRAAGLLLWARRQEISIDSGWWRARSSSGAIAGAAARRSAANASSVRFIADVGA